MLCPAAAPHVLLTSSCSYSACVEVTLTWLYSKRNIPILLLKHVSSILHSWHNNTERRTQENNLSFSFSADRSTKMCGTGQQEPIAGRF